MSSVPESLFMEVEESAIADDARPVVPAVRAELRPRTTLPTYFNEPKALDRLLAFTDESEGSDVHIGGEEPIRVRIHGHFQDVTARLISSSEAFDLLVQA